MRTKKQLTKAQRKSAAEARKQAMAELRKLLDEYNNQMTDEQRAVSPQRERVKREPVAADPAGDLFGWSRIA